MTPPPTPGDSCGDRPDEAVERAHGTAKGALAGGCLAIGEESERPAIEARVARKALDQHGHGRVRRETQVAAEAARGERPIPLEHAPMVSGAGVERRDRIDE